MNTIIDFHTHILPAIDDGSKDVSTSLKMVVAEREQDVDVIALTPHFYAWQDTIDEFLKKRDDSFSQMHSLMGSSIKVLLGAEITYFQGMSRASELQKLLFKGTDIMLVEMPFRRWKESEVEEIKDLAAQGTTVVLAHINRYIEDRVNFSFLQELIRDGIVMQMNVEALLKGDMQASRTGLKRIEKLIQSDARLLLGTDCHGAHHRVPNLKEGRREFLLKFGRYALKRIDSFGEELLKNSLYE